MAHSRAMNYLKQKNRAWYVRVIVPQHLRAPVGKSEYWVALKTRDLTTAKRLSHAHVARIMQELHEAEAHKTLPRESAEYIQQYARELRAEVAKGLTSEDNAETVWSATIKTFG